MTVQRWSVLGRVFMCLWVLFTIPTVVEVVQSGVGPIQVAITFAFCAWAVVWLWYWARACGRAAGAEWIGLLSNLVILGMFALIAPGPLVVGNVLVFVFIVAGFSFPVRRAVWVIAALSVVQVVGMVIRQESPPQEVSSLLNSLLVGGVGIGARLLWEAYTQLLAAREQLANLAVSEERLRFARDLHDLLGQSLSVIVLKSEVVAKQLPETVDESIKSEMRDIAQVARTSLNDVREAVAGYRQASLVSEISSARSALRAAGITLGIESSIDSLPSTQDAVFAWCLREAVTNVVKHSRAERCEVRLSRSDGTAMLEIADDGRGAAVLNGGSGLAGMRERVERLGGTVDVTGAAQGGVRVKVTLPV